MCIRDRANEGDDILEGDDAEENMLVQNAYTFLVGNGFHLVNMQPALYFVSEDEIRYVPGGEQSDEYYQYEIFLKTENYHDEQVWREWIRIGTDFLLYTSPFSPFSVGYSVSMGKIKL